MSFPRTIIFLLAAFCAMAATPQKSVVPFSITQDVGSGNEVFVSGAHPDLTSNGIQPLGVKLHWSSGNVWSGSIAIEAGAPLNFSYVSHAISTSGYCGGNSIAISSPISLTVPSAAGPPYSGKVIRYLSSWSTANLFFRDVTRNGAWTTAAMQRVDQGRTVSESVYEVGNVAAPGDEMEFIFTDGAGHYDNAPAPPQNPQQGAAPAVPVPYQSMSPPYNYRTRLDVFTVQDGQVYNYDPPAAVSPPTIEHRLVGSTVSGILERYIHIYLPRGYVQKTSKRYPVVYFQDGQNVFFPGGSFGTWDADRIATYEISQGRMREAIVVGIDNTGDRMSEYIPPGDQISGQATGKADKFVQFMRDNVLPTLDYNYRTLNQPGQLTVPAGNITAGSSLGGVVTAYIGMTNSSMFGKIGVFSPAFWSAPHFITDTLTPAPKLPLVIYMDIGSSESSSSQSSSETYWEDALSVYNTWLGDGYAVNSDLLMWPQCGAVHNEAAWSGRLPAFFQFALTVWSEGNPIALRKFPPRLDLSSVDLSGGSARLHFLAPLGAAFTLFRSTDLMSWEDQTLLPPATSIWEDRNVVDPFALPATRRFWRLQTTSTP
jgi:predicted alpha/beta superfamily hydrolase